MEKTTDDRPWTINNAPIVCGRSSDVRRAFQLMLSAFPTEGSRRTRQILESR